MEKKNNSNKVLLQVPFLFLRNSAKQSQSQLQYVWVQRWISAVLPHSQRRCNNHTFCLRCVFVNKQHIKNPLKILSSGQVPSSPLGFFFFPCRTIQQDDKTESMQSLAERFYAHSSLSSWFLNHSASIHRIRVEGTSGGHLVPCCGSSRLTKTVAWDDIKIPLKYLQGWRFHNFSGHSK